MQEEVLSSSVMSEVWSWERNTVRGEVRERNKRGRVVSETDIRGKKQTKI